MPVYFIRAGEDGPVKIGHADSPSVRLRSLQSAHHETLTIIRLVEGGAPEEKWFHQRFSASRIRGEWFTYHPDMDVVEPESHLQPKRSSSRKSRSVIVGKVIKKAGGAGRIAETFGISCASVSGWHRIPDIRVLPLEEMTGISRHEQRPDIFGAAPQ